MRILLDTHVLIWMQESVKSVGDRTLELVSDLENELYISPVSTLEIARLITSKQIELSISLKRWLSRAITELMCDTVPMSHEVARRAYKLKEPFHKDPADRMLVASAIAQNLTLLTADQRILGYPHVHSYDARK